MRPQGTRVWRKNGHKAWRGVPRGRRATHPVETTYGRHQALRDHLARWRAAREAERAA